MPTICTAPIVKIASAKRKSAFASLIISESLGITSLVEPSVQPSLRPYFHELAQKPDCGLDALGNLFFALCAAANNFPVLEKQERGAYVLQAHDGAGKLFRLVFDVVDFHGDVEQVQLYFEVSACNDVLDFEAFVYLYFPHSFFAALFRQSNHLFPRLEKTREFKNLLKAFCTKGLKKLIFAGFQKVLVEWGQRELPFSLLAGFIFATEVWSQ